MKLTAIIVLDCEAESLEDAERETEAIAHRLRYQAADLVRYGTAVSLVIPADVQSVAMALRESVGG